MEEVDLGRSSSLEVDDAPDPRIQVELEQLNTSTDTINKLEVDLDEARLLFRQLLADSTQRIDALAKRLGKCIEQARPYYEARIRAKQALKETQAAAVRYERAMSQHAAAREMVFLAEEGLTQKGCIFDHTWQEMLNHATSKVNDAEREKIESASEHRTTSASYHEAETRVKALQKELKRAIAKSSLNARRSLLQMNNLVRMHQLQLLPYFELKSAINQQLEAQKQRVRQLEENVASAKLTYSQALSNLETISDEIHRTRQSQLDLGVRGVGVGAESPLPPLQNVDGGIPLPTHPLHYGESTYHSDTQDEFRTLPKKLGAAAAPIIESEVKAISTAATALTCSVPSSESTVSVGTSTTTTIATVAISTQSLGESTSSNSPPAVVTLSHSDCGGVSGEVSSLVDAEDIVVEEVDGAATSTDLSGWQVIGLGSPTLSATQYLTVEDKDSIISDTESLASIEMLSDEAIAGLMLDEELAEASNYMCNPLSTPLIDQPLSLLTTLPGSPSVHDYVSPLQQSSEQESAGHSDSVQEGHSQYQCYAITHSLSELDLEDPVGQGSRRARPPDSLALKRDSSSDHSSPEDLTPAYVPLRDTPYSPEDFLPSSQNHSATHTGAASTSSNASVSEEAQDEPHRSSWVLENVPTLQENTRTHQK